MDEKKQEPKDLDLSAHAEVTLQELLERLKATKPLNANSNVAELEKDT